MRPRESTRRWASPATLCARAGPTVLPRVHAAARRRDIGFGVCEVRTPWVRNPFTAMRIAWVRHQFSMTATDALLVQTDDRRQADRPADA